MKPERSRAGTVGDTSWSVQKDYSASLVPARRVGVRAVTRGGAGSVETQFSVAALGSIACSVAYQGSPAKAPFGPPALLGEGEGCARDSVKLPDGTVVVRADVAAALAAMPPR